MIMIRLGKDETACAIESLKPRDTLINRIAVQLDLIDAKLGQGVSHTAIADVFGVSLKRFSYALGKARERKADSHGKALPRRRKRKPDEDGNGHDDSAEGNAKNNATSIAKPESTCTKQHTGSNSDDAGFQGKTKATEVDRAVGRIVEKDSNGSKTVRQLAEDMKKGMGFDGLMKKAFND